MKKKLAIISSYNTVCGNASYTHVLKNALQEHYDTDVLAIDHTLLSNAHKAAKKAKAKHIQNLAAKIKDYDCINIQFAVGLYGNSVATAVDNITPLIKASRNLVFTMHRVLVPSNPDSILKTIFKNGFKIGRTMRSLYQRYNYRMFNALITRLKAHRAAGNNVSIIVHTKRERDLLKLYYGYDDVIDFPITFLAKNDISRCINNKASVRDTVYEKYSLDRGKKHIGIFGFLSENKGHHVVVDALSFLPDDYNLVIAGSQHPLSVRDYDFSDAQQNPNVFHRNNNEYIASLIDLVNKTNTNTKKFRFCNGEISPRIRFMGNLDDEEFIRMMTAMDYIVVPYFETGQGGSGNASLALELECNVLFSRTFAFLELERYYPNCFEFFDIGNASELAQRILFWKGEYSDMQKKAKAKYCIENNALVYKEAFEACAQATRIFIASTLTNP